MKNNKLLFSLVILAMLTLGACGGSNAKEGSSEQGGTSETSEHSDSTSSSESSGSEEGSESSSQEHVHEMVFDSFVWTTNPDNYLAKAKYVCSSNDGYEELHDATITKIGHVDVDCEQDGSNTWKASYDGHNEEKIETLMAPGHSWGEPVWNWVGLNSSATATFTCARNPEHTHVETATGDDITEIEYEAPTCEVSGHRTYRATVTFNDQVYTDDKVEILQPTYHEELDEYGFCKECFNYQGEELNDPDLPVELNNISADSTFYYRFLHDGDYKYKLVTSSMVSPSWFSFYGKDLSTEQWKVLDVKNDSFGIIEDTYDDYVYIVMNNTAKIESGHFYIDMECAHNGGADEYGYCNDCGEYLGMTISLSQYNTEIGIPECEGGDLVFIRVELEEGKHITLYEDDDWVGHECSREEYYLMSVDSGDVTEISSSNFNGFHENAPTSTNDFFKLDNLEEYDGYLYILLECDAQDGFSPEYYKMTVSDEHFADEHGYCAFGDGEYLGTSVSVAKFNTNQEIHWKRNVPIFFRYEEIYRGHASDSTYAYVEYQFASVTDGCLQYFSIYYVKDGVWKSTSLSNSEWCQLPEHVDSTNPYIYLVFNYTGAGATGACLFRLNYRI